MEGVAVEYRFMMRSRPIRHVANLKIAGINMEIARTSGSIQLSTDPVSVEARLAC